VTTFSFDDPRVAYDDETHTYRANMPGTLQGSRLPSVTEIIKPLLPAEVTKYFTPESRDRGKRVHRMVQLDIEGRLDIAALDDELMSYYEGWQNFRLGADFKPELVEQIVMDSAQYYAGRLDLYGKLDGYPALIDIKTGVVDLRSAGPQTAGYLSAAAYEGLMPFTTRRFVLDLKPGRASLSKELTSKMDKQSFFACYHIYRRNRGDFDNE
jgi:hypothetical protein